MDSKRPYQYRALKQLLTIVCIMALTSCTWVKDERDECLNGFWLRLHYTYNILDVEAAQKYVKDADVYVYDADGQFVKRIHATLSDLIENGYRVKVEGLTEGDYQFVVWSGMGNSQYAVTADTQAMDDFRLSLAGAGSRFSGALPDLYYGYKSTVHYDDSYALYDVELMKNTNQLSCLVVSVSDQQELEANDYSMKVVAANSTMDARNRIVSGTETIYESFDQGVAVIDDPEYGELHGLKFNIMTLRLMSNSDSRLILEKKSTDQTLFNISFTEYIGMIGSFYTAIGRPLTAQEYLDRQDFYTIVFFLSDDLDQLIQLQVNSWRLRSNNHLKL